jgi:hypothetical protein
MNRRISHDGQVTTANHANAKKEERIEKEWKKRRQ